MCRDADGTGPPMHARIDLAAVHFYLSKVMICPRVP